MHSPMTSPLRVQAWPDPVIDRFGYLPTSAYFEWLWLPRIGPSTAWAYRLLTEGLPPRPARPRAHARRVSPGAPADSAAAGPPPPQPPSHPSPADQHGRTEDGGFSCSGQPDRSWIGGCAPSGKHAQPPHVLAPP